MNAVLRIIIGAVVGGALGFGYYKVIGCPTGGCPLTSNPWTSSLYGMLVGGLIASGIH